MWNFDDLPEERALTALSMTAVKKYLV
jgi:hypothetical protein